MKGYTCEDESKAGGEGQTRYSHLLDILSRVLLRLSTCSMSSLLSCWVPSSSRLPLPPPATKSDSRSSKYAERDLQGVVVGVVVD